MYLHKVCFFGIDFITFDQEDEGPAEAPPGAEEEEEEEEEEDEEAIDEKDWAGTKSTQIQTDTDQREFYEASRKNVLCVDITHFNK